MTDVRDAARPDLRLDGRCVILTGASQGIGAALASALHLAGARTVLAARHIADVEVTDEARQLAVACDVTVEGDRHKLVTTALEWSGRVDVLINNAGFARSAPALEETATDVKRTVDSNLLGPLRLCQLVGAGMVERGSGSIVNVASLIGSRSVDRYALASYAASKAAIIALTRELASQWGRDGVRVNAVAPGWFPTRMTGFLEDAEQADWIVRHTSLGRTGRLEEMVGPVLFLAGEASSYVTGQVLAVDGGWL